MADLTWSELRADLGQMRDTIGTVKRESDHIGGVMNSIAGEFGRVRGAWNSPSEQSFDDVQKWFTTVSTDLHQLLGEIVIRLDRSYANYRAAEESNYNNAT